MKGQNIGNTAVVQEPEKKQKVKRRRGEIRIGWKITSIITLVFTILAISNILFIRHRLQTVMEKEFKSKAKAIALSLASASEDKLLSGNIESIQYLVESNANIFGVKYVYVNNDKDEAVAHTFGDEFPTEIMDLNPVSADAEYTMAEIDKKSVGRVLEVGVPILFGVAGHAHVGMDRDLIIGEMASMTNQLIFQFAGAFILGVILLHLAVRYFLKPMNAILVVLKNAGGGDLTGRLNINTRDEFMVLAEGLNGMLESLSGIINRVRRSFISISQANEKISQVYTVILSGTQKQADLAAETEGFVKLTKEMIDDVNSATQVLENSATTSFSSVMEMGASVEEVSAMSDSLFQSVRESNQALEEMSASINEISATLLSLSSTTDDTLSAMNEMGASIMQVRENARGASEDSIKMTETAKEGKEHSEAATEGALAIKESSALVSSLVSTVSERVEEIDEIISFITDITGKTNLLALNAAIIAAQAGSHGKGFGVVADEINELAHNTKAQTNRIAGVIEGILDEVSQVDSAVRESVSRVEAGVHLTQQAGSSLEKILNSTSLVSDRVEEIAQTTSEQSKTSQRVIESTEHLTESTKNIKEAGQKQSESSEKILAMSRRIEDVAQKVKNSTQEQTQTSQQINEDLTRIDETVKNIADSTEKQAESGAKVLKMTGDLAEVIKVNKDAVLSLREVIDDLSGRMGALQSELGTFVLGDSEDG